MKKIFIVVGLFVLLFVIALYNQARSEMQVERDYLHENRPDVVAAVQAYRAATGHYPASLTNAIPRYYRGNQEKVFFLNAYHYRDLGTNFSLRRFPNG